MQPIQISLKKLCIALFLLTSGCAITSNSDNFNPRYVPLAKFSGDTLQYLQKNFKENQQKYQGKKLEVLLKDLEMPVRSCIALVSTPSDSIHGVGLDFYAPNEMGKREYYSQQVTSLLVVFKRKIATKDIRLLIDMDGEWTAETKQPFNESEIKEILVYHKNAGASFK